eukprot:582384-Hanusia_phi.AAC.4
MSETLTFSKRSAASLNTHFTSAPSALSDRQIPPSSLHPCLILPRTIRIAHRTATSSYLNTGAFWRQSRCSTA